MSYYTEEQWTNWVDLLSENDYVIVDNFLDTEIYTNLTTLFNCKIEDDKFKKAAIGALNNREIVESIRGDFTYWLYKDKNEESIKFFEVVDEMVFYLNKLCFLSLSGYEFHFAFYPPGSFYAKHLDRFKNRSNRMISVILYFNEDWKTGDGGELRIFKTERTLEIQPKANRLVLFKSGDLEHEVLVTQAGRKSLTGWLLYQPASLGYLLT